MDRTNGGSLPRAGTEVVKMRAVFAVFLALALLGTACAEADSIDLQTSTAPGTDATALGYDVHIGGPGAVTPVATHRFLHTSWDDWFDIVIATTGASDPDAAASVGGPSLGSWMRQTPDRLALGYVEGPGDRPHPPGRPGALPWWDREPESFDRRSAQVDHEGGIVAEDPQTGAQQAVDAGSNAPNAFINRRFVWEDGIPPTFERIEQAAVRGLDRHAGPTEDALVRALLADDTVAHIAQALGLDVGDVDGGAVRDRVCDTCADLVAVWHRGAALPLLSAEVLPDGQIRGALVTSFGPPTDRERAVLRSAAPRER
jgi:hypothetical protein